MKTKQFLFAALSLSFLCSCTNQVPTENNKLELNQADHTTYLCLSSIGTYTGAETVEADIPEMFLENTIVFHGAVGSALPTKAEVKSTSGAIFKSWVAYEGEGAPREYTTVPAQNNKILYAYFVSSNITITSLSYEGTPVKTSYDLDQGETTFDPTGITVKAHMSDGSEETVPNSDISWGKLVPGATSVTGTYRGKSVTVTGLTITGTVTDIVYTVTDMPTWITNDGCKVFAWAWGGSDAGEGKWISTTYTDTTTLQFTVSAEITGMLLARCHADTTLPNWNEKGNVAGRVYNQTNDMKVSPGVYTYKAADWKEYNPA